ncbi:MAG: GNAT family N-acetyltransferase [Candidatus Endonucleobacter sp. (ex Gigantidas childressi)]|nr:GNAT family N-acetyltransferase [Candidatus Endonucleobacter sp. (ex Gigantidas childressi)]
MTIRTWQESDFPNYASLIGENSDDLSRFSASSPNCRAETELWRYQLEQDRLGWSRWAIICKKSNALIGYCGFSPYHDDVEISWRFAQDWRSSRLAIDAIKAVAQVGFQKLSFNKVIAFARADNSFSIEIMEKVGMKLERTEGWSNCIVARYSISCEYATGAAGLI